LHHDNDFDALAFSLSQFDWDLAMRLLQVILALHRVIIVFDLRGEVVLHVTGDGPYYGDSVAGPYGDPVGDVLTVHVVSLHDDSVGSNFRFEQLVLRLRMAVQ